jgi:excisionase family DNA binding protein
VITRLALARAERRLAERLCELEMRLDAGESGVWDEYVLAAQTLAAVAPLTTPEAQGKLLTTEQLADRLQVSTRTVRRRAKRGELQPIRLGERGRAALRWKAAEAGR